jgi:hypothetical protein
MPLRLNLYHETIKERALKRRDPLKISIYVLSSIAALCAAWYTVQLIAYHAYLDDYQKKKAEFDKIEPAGKIAKKKQDELTAKANQSIIMGNRIENRFYWAPILSQLSQVVPREVQITRLGGEVSNDPLRHCAITIDGLAAGPDPRRVAEELRTAIAQRLGGQHPNVTSTFKSLEDGSETVALDGHQTATATFTINVLFHNQEAATPPPRGKRK